MLQRKKVLEGRKKMPGKDLPKLWGEGEGKAENHFSSQFQRKGKPQLTLKKGREEGREQKTKDSKEFCGGKKEKPHANE